MTKYFEYINLFVGEVSDFIVENGLSFLCNDNMQIYCSEEDFNSLLTQFPFLDYIECDPE